MIRLFAEKPLWRRRGFFAPVIAVAVCLLYPECSRGQLVLTESMAANRVTLQDSDGNPSDWVEIHNPSQQSVELTGWYLTDDPVAAPQRWRFPKTALAPNAYLVVFCSGKNRADSSRELHTNFRLAGKETVTLFGPDGTTEVSRLRVESGGHESSSGRPQRARIRTLVGSATGARFRVPDQPQDTAAWRFPEFDDRTWDATKAAFGFNINGRLPPAIATDSTALVRGRGTSVYVRIPFEIEDPSHVESLVLGIESHGGYVAWLNGREVGRRGFDGEPVWNSIARAPIDEFEAMPLATRSLDSSRLKVVQGRNVLAVQLLFETRYTDEAFIAPTLTAFAVEGAPDTEIVVFDQPTPGWPNVAPARTESRLPDLTPAHSLFTDPVVVTLGAGAEAPDTPIRYTLDGSDPTETSPVYTAPLSLKTTAELRARYFPSSGRPGPVASGVYVRRAPDLSSFTSNLPIIAVTTFARKPDKIFARSHVHALAPGGNTQRASFDAKADYSGFGGLKTRGSSTLQLQKKSYALELRDELGSDAATSLFGLPADADWILYGAFNFDHSHLRNPLVFEMSRRLGLSAPRWRFVEVFLNAGGDDLSAEDYVGLYVLIEKIERAKHRVAVERLDPSHIAPPEITGGYILKVDRPGPGDKGFSGGGEKLQFVYPKEDEVTDAQRRWIREWLDRFGQVLNGPLSFDPTNGYASFIDVDNFIDYHFLNEYVRNPDAYTLSTYMHLPRGGKLRMGPVWDFDRAMRTNTDPHWVGRPAETEGWTGDCYHAWWGLLFRDPAFRARYRERGRDHLGSLLHLDAVFADVDRLAQEIREAQSRDLTRWPILSPDAFENDLVALKDWFRARDRWFRAELLEAPELESSTGRFRPPFRLRAGHANPTGDLYLTFDGSDPRLADGRVSPRARLWEDPIEISTETWVRARVKVGDLWTRSVQEHCVTTPVTLTITELMYNPGGGRDFEFIEVHNFGKEPVILDGLTLTGGVRFAFSLGSATLLAPNAYGVIVNDRRKFATRYDASTMTVLGEYLGRLSNTDGTVQIHGRIGELIVEAHYQDWYPETDGRGHSLITVDKPPNPSLLRVKESWRPSRQPDGTPGHGGH